MKPGVYEGIPNAEYHGGPGISKSGLDLVHRSPMHYNAVVTASNDRTPTPAQELGTAAHAIILEPHVFDESYVLAPKFDRRTKEGKAAAAAFEDENAGKICLLQETWDQLFAMAAAVNAHPAAGSLLTSCPGEAEKSVYWIDATTGVLCRCRPDWWRDDNVIVDLKTTEDASQEGFAKSIANWRYDVQAAYYLDGVQQATGKRPKAFVFIAVEKKPPYGVGVYVLDSESLDLGRAQYQHDLRIYAECVRTGVWPGYGDKIQTISLPAWHANKNSHLLEAI